MTQSAKVREKKKRRGRPRVEEIHCVMAIRDWDWSFSFGISRTKHLPGPYWDFRHLLLRGELLRPAKLTANEVELTLMPEDGIEEDVRHRREPKNVGSLQLHRGRLTGLLPIPPDALPPVLQMLVAERFRFAVLATEPFRYGRAGLRNYRLEQTLDEDDLPPER